jgi:hypothetical protein
MTKYPPISLKTLAAIGWAVCTMIPLTAQAAATSGADDWKLNGSVYLWAAAIRGETARGNNVDIGFEDIYENLDMTFMGALEARSGKWFLGADLIYLDLSGSKDGMLDAPPGFRTISGSATLTSWVVTPTAGYRLIENQTGSMDVFDGLRYFYVDTTAALSTSTALTAQSGKISKSPHVLDGILGVKGQLNLAGNWHLPYYVDIGAGDSDFTWQTYGGVDYQRDNLNIFAGYRYMAWNLRDMPVDNLNLSGPIVGVKYQF